MRKQLIRAGLVAGMLTLAILTTSPEAALSYPICPSSGDECLNPPHGMLCYSSGELVSCICNGSGEWGTWDCP
jgi:hypothetical protein